jgi:outer membrane protein assembly factor BamB
MLPAGSVAQIDSYEAVLRRAVYMTTPMKQHESNGSVAFMNVRRAVLVLSAMLPMLGWSAAGWAWDWPQFGGGDARNMASDEKGIAEKFTPGKKNSDGSGIDLKTTRNVKWVAKLGSENYSSPVVANGKVFIGVNDSDLDDPRYKSTGGGALLGLDENTGKLLWRLVVPKLMEGKRSQDYDDMHLGVCSTPTVDGDRVYIVTNRCDVLCLDINGMMDGNGGQFFDEARYSVEPGEPPVEPRLGDADIVWRFDMLNQLPVFPHDASSCSPLVFGDCIYIGTGNGVDDGKPPMPMSPSVIVLDKKTGRLLAKDDEMIGSRVFHGQWSSPSLGIVNNKPMVFYGAGDGVCYAFEALRSPSESTGFLPKAWSFDCNTPEHKIHDGKPVTYDDGDKRDDNTTNHNDWNYLGLDEIIATPVFYKNRVYVAVGRDPLHGAKTKGGLFCIDATKTGDITQTGAIWRYADVGRSLSTVSIADGLLYISDDAGRVHCLDAETGKVYWVHDTQHEIWSSTLVVDGKVYVGTRKDFVVLAAGKEAKVLAQINLGSQVRSTPAVSDGVLYVASQRYLWAVQADNSHATTAANEQNQNPAP